MNRLAFAVVSGGLVAVPTSIAFAATNSSENGLSSSIHEFRKRFNDKRHEVEQFSAEWRDEAVEILREPTKQIVKFSRATAQAAEDCQEFITEYPNVVPVVLLGTAMIAISRPFFGFKGVLLAGVGSVVAFYSVAPGPISSAVKKALGKMSEQEAPSVETATKVMEAAVPVESVVDDDLESESVSERD